MKTALAWRLPETLRASPHGEIRVLLAREQAGWGEEVGGALVLQGFARPTEIFSVRIGFGEELRSLTRTSFVEPPVRWERLLVRPHEALRLPFFLRVPWGHFLDGALAVRLAVAPLDLPDDRVGDIPFRVAPPPLYSATAELLGELAGMRVRGWQVIGPGDAARAHLRPPPGADHPLAGLDLDLGGREALRATVTRLPRIRSLGEAARRLAGVLPAPVTLDLPPADPDEARRRLTAAGFSRGRGDLPIPAAPSQDPRVLPRPAPSPAPSGEDLPRPAPPPE